MRWMGIFRHPPTYSLSVLGMASRWPQVVSLHCTELHDRSARWQPWSIGNIPARTSFTPHHTTLPYTNSTHYLTPLHYTTSPYHTHHTMTLPPLVCVLQKNWHRHVGSPKMHGWMHVCMYVCNMQYASMQDIKKKGFHSSAPSFKDVACPDSSSLMIYLYLSLSLPFTIIIYHLSSPPSL
jgi:hypothetical protein